MKIIGVGISKTGTSSLAAALRLLGFPCVHGWPPSGIERAAALVDTPAACRYRELDVIYPGSKFILTTRERESWLRSCEKHWQRMQFAPDRPDVRFEFLWCRAHLFGRLDFDPDNHWQSYLRHLEGVRAYFADRASDLLEIDIPGGDGWEPLCRFLGLPVPAAPFPWKNRSPGEPSGREGPSNGDTVRPESGSRVPAKHSRAAGPRRTALPGRHHGTESGEPAQHDFGAAGRTAETRQVFALVG